jgi:acyl-coenzyme A thioesterase PaaI-like protein
MTHPLPPFASPARGRLAEAIRHLIDATLTLDQATEEELAAAAQDAERLAQRLSGASPGQRPSGKRARPTSSHAEYLLRSPLVEGFHPIAPPFQYEHRDGRTVGSGYFSAAHEGPPGLVHGGWIALAFDEMLGMVNAFNEHPGMTAILTIKYRRPTPLHCEVHMEAWVDRTDGRRAIARAELRAGNQITAEAEGTFVMVDPDRAVRYFASRARSDLGEGSP